MDFFGDALGTAAIQAAANQTSQQNQMDMAGYQAGLSNYYDSLQAQRQLAAYGAQKQIDTGNQLRMLAAQTAAQQHLNDLALTQGNLNDFLTKNLGSFRSVADAVNTFKAMYPNDPHAQALNPAEFSEDMLPAYQKQQADISQGQQRLGIEQQQVNNQDPNTVYPLRYKYETKPTLLNQLDIAHGNNQATLLAAQTNADAANLRSAAQNTTQLQIAAGHDAQSNVNSERQASTALGGQQTTLQAARLHVAAQTAAGLQTRAPETFLAPQDYAEFQRAKGALNAQNQFLAHNSLQFYNRATAEQDQMIVNNLLQKGQAAKEAAIRDAQTFGPTTGVTFSAPQGYPAVHPVPGLPVLPAAPGGVDVMKQGSLTGAPAMTAPRVPRGRRLMGRYGGGLG